MVAAGKLPCAFDDLNVFGFFNNADEAAVAATVGADAADGLAGNVAADSAELNAGLDCVECGDEAVDVFGFLVQDVKCDALGAFWPDAGQSGEFVDEILQWSFKHECLVYPLRRITRENPASGLIL